MSYTEPLDLVKLRPLMEITSGKTKIVVGLIDGPVATDHPDFAEVEIREIPGRISGSCAQTSGNACTHGTFVAGILCAKRGSVAPAICPNCTLLVRAIFDESVSENVDIPSTTPEELARAIIETTDAGASVINLSAALIISSPKGMHELKDALDYAARSSVIIVAATGNQGTIGSTIITRHMGVIPVAACDPMGRPIAQSNFGSSIGRRGLSAPGYNITSLGADGNMLTLGGTSAAAPFVTGAIALLLSAFPNATIADVRLALMQANTSGRNTVVPPLLDAWAAYHIMQKFYSLKRG